MDADLLELGRRAPLVGVLGVLSDPARGDQPHRSRGSGLRRRRNRSAFARSRKLPADEGGWVLLEELPGARSLSAWWGKFWRPVIQFAEVSAGSFSDFAEPGYAKTVYDLSVRPIDGGTRSLLS